jgi:hypothetical protein
MPMEKSLQHARPFQLESPACHARLPHGTNWRSSPSRRMRKCADTFAPATVA